jgi:hypothetical protein
MTKRECEELESDVANVKIWKEIEDIRKDQVEIWAKLKELNELIIKICKVWKPKERS